MGQWLATLMTDLARLQVLLSSVSQVSPLSGQVGLPNPYHCLHCIRVLPNEACLTMYESITLRSVVSVYMCLLLLQPCLSPFSRVVNYWGSSVFLDLK